MLSSFLPVRSAKRRLILHSSSTLFGIYGQMLSSLLSVQYAKKKTYPALLFDSRWRLHISRCRISFTNAMCKKGLSFSPLRLSLAFMARCCLLFYQCNMIKEDLSYTPLRLSLEFMPRCCLLFYQCEVQKRRLILHSSSILFGVYV
jgi:hypothetical protein